MHLDAKQIVSRKPNRPIGKLALLVVGGLVLAFIGFSYFSKMIDIQTADLASVIQTELDEQPNDVRSPAAPGRRDLCNALVGAAGAIWLNRPYTSLADQMEGTEGKPLIEWLVLTAYSYPANGNSDARNASRQRYLEHVEYECYAAR